tara:strand:- start:53 stop:334 length:282 start_codon:yes stop_codon:yes gene_type:complete
MGLMPENIRQTTVYDFNLMARAFEENILHDYTIMRLNSYLVSVYSGLDNKGRKKLTPNKMLPLKNDSTEKRMDREQFNEIIQRSNKRREQWRK